MVTEENDPGLYGALYNAMTDPKLIGNLIEHPEFIRHARRICQGIAGPEKSEDLLQEVCLRMLELVSQLHPNTIRNEREFFEWFSLLARRVHLSRVWSVAAVSSCTHKDAGWPDVPTDIPPDEMDQFLTHADACPYHMRLLNAEEKKLRAVFRRARALDSHGRLLGSAELNAQITDHKRRTENWRAAAFREGRLFGHVALFNGGKEIASCGKFYDFSIHISRNELDPDAGIQILGVAKSNVDERVMLGFYPLAGVEHKGEEKTFELDNGYTVGLSLKQVAETTFDIRFRCVETKTPEAEGITGDAPADEIVIETSTDDSPESFAPPPQFPVPMPVSSGWYSISAGKQAGAIFTLLLLVAIPCFLIGATMGQIPAGDKSVEQVNDPQSVPQSLSKRIPEIDEWEWNSHFAQTLQSPNSNSAASANRLRAEAEQSAVAPEAETRTNTNYSKSPLDSPRGISSFTAKISKRESGISSAPNVVSGQPVAANFSSNPKVDDQRAQLRQLISYGWDSTANISLWNSSASLEKTAYEGQRRSVDVSILHTATNEVIISTVSDALLHEHFQVKRVAHHEQARFTIAWVGWESQWRENSPNVKLSAYVYRNGEKNSVYEFSYEVAGDSTDAAYKKAVGMIIKPVIDWIRVSEERLGSAPNGNGANDQIKTDAPPSNQLIGERKDEKVIGPGRRERRTVPFRAEDKLDDRPPQAEEIEEN